MYELENDPEQPRLFIEIAYLRAYDEAKRIYDDWCADTSEDKQDLPDDPMIELVQDIEAELVEEELAADEEE